MRSTCYLCLCACVYVCPLINLWMPEPIFIKLCMYIFALESISTAYFINPSHQSVCLYVYPLIVARQRLSKHVPATMNTRNNRRIVERPDFNTVSVLSKESLWARLYIPILVYVPLKRWSEGSQSRQTVKYGHEFRGTRNQEQPFWREPASIC
jgi:hypothetical protein